MCTSLVNYLWSWDVWKSVVKCEDGVALWVNKANEREGILFVVTHDSKHGTAGVPRNYAIRNICLRIDTLQ